MNNQQVAQPLAPDVWEGCYGQRWKGLLVSEAFAHPAKYSKALIFRIVDHALAEGWLHPGATVLDPFGGIASGALPCLLKGINWVGVELEETFVALGRANLAYWRQRYGHRAMGASAVLLQGDSRTLGEVLTGGVESVVCSPPFCQSDYRKGGSDLYRRHQLARGHSPDTPSMHAYTGAQPYGNTVGQLGNMPTGQVEAVLSSPPYADGCAHTGGADPQPQHIQGGEVRHVAYGYTNGQLGNMVSGEIELDCQQNPDRMLCSVHNKLSGDSVWQSAKTAAQLYHETPAGASPAAESIVANPSPPVPSVDVLSVAAPTSVAPATPSKTVRHSRGKSSAQKTAKDSSSITSVAISPMLQKPSSVPHNCDVPPNVLHNASLTIATGEVLDSAACARSSSSGTTTHASNVELQVEVSLSTTSETSRKPEASGTIALTTSKPSVDDATFFSTPTQCAPVSNVVPNSNVPTSNKSSALHAAKTPDAIDSKSKGDTPETFWNASKQILQQVFDLLKPGGHCIWVTKRYVRNGQIVDFTGDWARLNIAVGFKLLHEHWARLGRVHGIERSLLDGSDVLRESRNVGFFRRANEAKGSPRIDFEVIQCFIKGGS
jgi:hypothetical protein